MIPCTAYTEVPLWKNLDFPRSPNSPCFNANPMPKKSEPSDSATKMLVRLPSKKSGFEIVLMIKLAGLTNGRVILRQF
jgi:hypothetical protein